MIRVIFFEELEDRNVEFLCRFFLSLRFRRKIELVHVGIVIDNTVFELGKYGLVYYDYYDELNNKYSVTLPDVNENLVFYRLICANELSSSLNGLKASSWEFIKASLGYPSMNCVNFVQWALEMPIEMLTPDEFYDELTKS